jgi:hypothetical protein
MSGETGRLPHIDRHSLVVDSDAERAWEALLRVAEATVSSAGASRFANVLGCADTEASGPRPLAQGSAFPGFHVAAATAPTELALAGSHRFSDYALIFRLEEVGPGRTEIGAETRARFPQFKGAVYRALVIGTRMHVLATRRILTGVKGRAERR